VLQGIAWHGVDGPHRGPHDTAHDDNAQRGAGGGGWRWDGQREGVHVALPWASTHPPNTVQGTSSQRGGWAMEMRSSMVRSTASELNDGEGVGSSSRGAAPSSGEALGPAHGEEGGVRWLGTDDVVGIEVRCGGDGLPETDKRHCADKRRWRRQDAMGWPPFIVVHCVGATQPAQGERKGGDGSVRRQSQHALARHRVAASMGAA
jgi:hypothetical protein